MRVIFSPGGEMHLMFGITGGDHERNQRVGVTDRGKAGKQHTHADEPTPGNPAIGDAFAHSDGKHAAVITVVRYVCTRAAALPADRGPRAGQRMVYWAWPR
jgi:hypothetical protein